MKLINIPEDINDITDLSEFKDTIKEVNIFSRNLEMFARKICLDKFLKWDYDWNKILKKSDKLKIIERSNNFLLYDYKNKSFTIIDNNYMGWSMGAKTHKTYNFTFNDDASVIIIKVVWKTQEARFDHVPWITHNKEYYLDYINETVLSKEEFSKRITLKTK